MSINIYEGEKKYVKYNHLLKKRIINGLTKRPRGQTKVIMKYDIDVNGILNVEIKEESPDDKGQSDNFIIKNDEVSLSNDEMEQLKKKMKDLLEKFRKDKEDDDNNYINIKKLLKGYKEAFNKCDEKMKNKKKKDDDDESDDEDDIIIYIKNYYTTLENFINKFDKNFDNETILYKFYLYIKDLFENYLLALKLDLDQGDKMHIFEKINEYIQIFINKSSGYLNELLEILSSLKKKRRTKIMFYQIIIFVVTKLNELGRKTIVSEKPFCKHHSLMYFEQSNNYFEKYFPKISESISKDGDKEANLKGERENVNLLSPKDLIALQNESKLCLEYINDIKSGAIFFCEEFLQKGVLINEDEMKSSNRGVTEQIKEHNLANLNRMNRDLQKKCLDNYEKLLSNIQITNDFTKKEAICIASIININYIISHDFSNKVRYLLYLARRCEGIVDHLHDFHKENEQWYQDFTKLYNILITLAPQDKNYPELLQEMKKKNPDIFKELDDNFKNMSLKDFIKFIVEKHPYKGKENDTNRNFDTDSSELITFLLRKYLPDDYNYLPSNEPSKLKYCLAQEISKKLNSIYRVPIINKNN